ncbi:uncharacterized protein N7515_002803 [Penicillium bovifimosum]|uniref:Uncharacterized protein n=1 Tax=Penicillium bovifimosum TaxID=126998 RepID=A0A9W9L9R1_9EURO|nr:uncharacterized protein N7515_002803 [Penicillium bovifimosum]KAJ5144016.1 hypothetical protein N7515_002803 [Penicillium bovifimosum]
MKKHGHFFNSEIPAIVKGGTPVLKCVERYGLYLLDEVEAPFNFAAVKTSPRPGVSIATPKTWHRRVGHLYEIWRLALVV